MTHRAGLFRGVKWDPPVAANTSESLLRLLGAQAQYESGRIIGLIAICGASSKSNPPPPAVVKPSEPPPFWVSSDVQSPLSFCPVSEVVAEKPPTLKGPAPELPPILYQVRLAIAALSVGLVMESVGPVF